MLNNIALLDIESWPLYIAIPAFVLGWMLLCALLWVGPYAFAFIYYPVLWIYEAIRDHRVARGAVREMQAHEKALGHRLTDLEQMTSRIRRTHKKGIMPLSWNPDSETLSEE